MDKQAVCALEYFITETGEKLSEREIDIFVAAFEIGTEYGSIPTDDFRAAHDKEETEATIMRDGDPFN